MSFPPDNCKHVISHSILATNVRGAGRIIISYHELVPYKAGLFRGCQ